MLFVLTEYKPKLQNYFWQKNNIKQLKITFHSDVGNRLIDLKENKWNGTILQNELQMSVPKKTVQKCSPTNNMAWRKKVTVPG